jgi:hypothetical protein
MRHNQNGRQRFSPGPRIDVERQAKKKPPCGGFSDTVWRCRSIQSVVCISLTTSGLENSATVVRNTDDYLEAVGSPMGRTFLP